MRQKDDNQGTDKVLFTAMLLLLLFASPVTEWWARAGLHWGLPYLLWAAAIAVIALAARRGDRDER